MNNAVELISLSRSLQMQIRASELCSCSLRFLKLCSCTLELFNQCICMIKSEKYPVVHAHIGTRTAQVETPLFLQETELTPGGARERCHFLIFTRNRICPRGGAGALPIFVFESSWKYVSFWEFKFSNRTRGNTRQGETSWNPIITTKERPGKVRDGAGRPGNAWADPGLLFWMLILYT